MLKPSSLMILVFAVVSFLTHPCYADTGDSILVIFDGSGITGGTGWVDDGTVVKLATDTDSVGIGILAPSQKLDVNGYVKGTGLCIGLNCITGWGSVSGVGGSGTLNYIAKFTGTGSTIGSSQIYDNGTNVGIGTTEPLAQLHIASNTTTTARITSAGSYAEVFMESYGGTLSSPTATANGSILGRCVFGGHTGSGITGNRAGLWARAKEDFTPTANGTQLEIWTTPLSSITPTLKLVIDPSGNIGIGTANPANLLHLYKDGTGGVDIFSFGDATGRYLVAGFNSTSNFAYLQAQGTTGDIRFRSNGAATPQDNIVIKNNGNVGIGTTSPRQRVDISGNLDVTGAIGLGADVNTTYGLLNTVGGTATGNNNYLLSYAGNPIFNTGTYTGLKVANIWLTTMNKGGTGTIDNAYQLYVNSEPTIGTNNYSLYVNSGKSYFGGNVGIGTTSPGAPLDIVGADGEGGPYYGTVHIKDSAAMAANVGGSILLWGKYHSGGAQAEAATIKAYKENAVSGEYGFGLGLSTRLNGAGLSEKVRITSVGNVGIGTTSPAQKLQVVGDIRVGTSGTNGCIQNFGGGVIGGTCSSDGRFKKNIIELTNSLEKITSLHPVTFEWKKEEYPEKHFGQGKNWGLVAEDVEKVLPELVGKDADGYKTVSYGTELQMLTIHAIKEQQKQIESQQKENENLQKQINELKVLIQKEK